MKYLAQINREIGYLSFASLKESRYLFAFEYDNIFCDLFPQFHTTSHVDPSDVFELLALVPGSWLSYVCTFDEEFAFLLNSGKDVCVVCYFAAKKKKKGWGFNYPVAQGSEFYHLSLFRILNCAASNIWRIEWI